MTLLLFIIILQSRSNNFWCRTTMCVNIDTSSFFRGCRVRQLWLHTLPTTALQQSRSIYHVEKTMFSAEAYPLKFVARSARGDTRTHTLITAFPHLLINEFRETHESVFSTSHSLLSWKELSFFHQRTMILSTDVICTQITCLNFKHNINKLPILQNLFIDISLYVLIFSNLPVFQLFSYVRPF
jgi:hypothetical protein